MFDYLFSKKPYFDDLLETLRHIPDLVIIIDSEGNILFCNHAAEQMLGSSRVSLIGEDIKVIFLNKSPESAEFLKKTLTGKADSNAIDACIQSDDTIIPIRLTIKKLSNKNGKSAFAIIAHDTSRAKVLSTEQKERILAVSALIESEERYRQIIHTIEDGYFETDLKGNLTFFNESLQKIIGHTEERTREMNYREFMDEQNAQEVFRTFNRVFRTGIPEKAFNWEIISADGTRHIVETSVSLICQHGGKPNGFRGIVRDITERKEIERKLRQSEERLRKFVNTAVDLIWFADAGSRITFANPSTLRLLKIAPEDILGKHCLELVHPRYRNKAARFYLRQYLKQDPISYYEFPVAVGDEILWFGQTLQLIIENGKVVEFIGIARNISERKAFEDRLKQSEERYRTLTENSSDIISEVDLDGKYAYVSSNVMEILGFSPQEVIGRRFTDFVHPKDQSEAERVWRERIPEFTLRFKSKSGEWRWLDCASRVFRLSDGRERVVTISRDVTERKKEEEKLRENEMRLRLQQMALAELAKHESLHRGDIRAAFRTINMVACHNLSTVRSAIWLFHNEEKQMAECYDLFDSSKNCHSEGACFNISSHEELLKELDTIRIIAIQRDTPSDIHAQFLKGYPHCQDTQSFLIVSFRLGGNTIGMIAIEETGKSRAWTTEEKQFAASLADFASLAMETHNRKIAEESLRLSEEMLRKRTEIIEKDLKNAQIIQRALLPNVIPVTDILRIEYKNFSVDAVGGDYFSFTPLSEGGLGVFIGDVSGHGVSAALFLSLLKATADRACRRYGQNPKEFIDYLNRELIETMPHYFVTAIYGYFTRAHDDNAVQFTFSKGGHPNPIIRWNSTGHVEMLRCRGTILGKFDHASYEEISIPLRRGDRIFLYTDGLPEMSNPEKQMLGFNELVHLIGNCMKDDLKETLDAILAEADSFRKGAVIEDDIVLIGLEVL
jgi:PAS domain S-box-containing protein